MNQHNKIIFQALNDYVQIQKPGYAVMIKGEWGCGKSFFIKNWIDTIESTFKGKERSKEDDLIRLKPIYVSLNGLRSTSQIDESLKRAISPLLYSKIAKGIGKTFKLLTSVAVRYNVDINKDNETEQLVCTIDPKMLLSLDPTKVKGNKLLIFDDVERAEMPIKEIFGYINYFVEQVGCHVVMISDDKNISEQKAFKTIKEKTIGHEYKIEAETDEALNVFINEIDLKRKASIGSHKTLITRCFYASRVNNLRILKQSLYDYMIFVSHLPDSILKAREFENIKTYLLANFIVVYAEYKSGNSVMEDYYQKLLDESIRKMNTPNGDKKDELIATETTIKYQKAGLTESYRVLKEGYADCIMSYLQKGEIDADFLFREIIKDRSTPWTQLSNYMSLENVEFQKALNHTAGHLESGDFKNIDSLLFATCTMLIVIKKGLTHNYTAEKVIEWSLKSMSDKFFVPADNLNTIYELRTHAYQCLRYYQGESIALDIERLKEEIGNMYMAVSHKKKDSLTILFENLSDQKIDELKQVYYGAIHDHSVTYSRYPIFFHVNAEKFVNGYVRLTNLSKKRFIDLIRSHYFEAFSVSNAVEKVQDYEDDLKTLPKIISKLNKKADQEDLVNRYNINYLANLLEDNCNTMRKLIKERDGK
ncbi:MAG: hypothetical protein J6W18_08235 [Bacteroidaceae bacterium]|nr:hypothetical protein [Bacteroidaceae bacterium]